MRVEQFLRDSAHRLSGKTALVAGEARLSYRDLDRLSDRLAAALVAGGVARGDRVAVFMENCWQAVVAIFAVLKADAVFSPLNPSTKAEKLAFILKDCKASAVVTHTRLLAATDAAVAVAPSVKLVVHAGGNGHHRAHGRIAFEDAIANGASRTPDSAGIDLDLAMLIYTSGTTGFPKGVMMTHQNVVAAVQSVNLYLGNTADDVILSVLPVSHNYGLYQVLTAAAVGASVVLEKSFAFPQVIFKKMIDERVTGLPIVPTMAAILAPMQSLSGDQFPHLRYLTSASAPLPPAHISRLRELFPRVRFFSMYGQTECVRGTYLPPEQLKERADSVGIAIPGTETWIEDEDGVRIGPGVVGELVIRGPHVMQGYWGNPQATERVLKPGLFAWQKVLYTGDLFRTDAEGYLYFVGRRDDIIKTRGEKVSPREVETVLYTVPGVQEAAVIGVADPILGSAIKAVVALAPGARVTEQDVIRHCARHLEDFMVPKSVAFLDALPKTDTGKISRRLIEAELMETAA